MSVPSSRLLFGLVPWYSVLIVIGAALAVWLASREEKIIPLPKDTIIDLALYVLPIGILGARLYYVAFSWETFRRDPIRILYIWEGGLAIYGGLIAGLLVIVVFCRLRKLSVRAVCDAVAPGVALAQSIGRWGNYFNQEAYGLPLRNPALCFFPLAVQINEGGTPVWHMATFFYESLLDLVIFLFLLRARRRWFRRRGDVLFFYLFLYGAARLVVENFRMDSLYAGRSVRISQLLSLLCCIALLIFYLHRSLLEERSLSPFARLLACLAFLDSIPALLFCLGFSSWLPSVGGQALFLGLYSLLITLALFSVYGKSQPSEVLYAYHAT